jgi:hypothetical protein
MPWESTPENAHSKGATSAPPEDDTFAGISREHRATKADDAEVPEYLWQEHLENYADPLKNFDLTTWTEEHHKARPILMAGLRKLGLKWWKKKVTLSFVGWLDNQYSAARKPKEDSFVVWSDGAFAWAGQKGKQSYLGWHL